MSNISKATIEMRRLLWQHIFRVRRPATRWTHWTFGCDSYFGQ